MEEIRRIATICVGRAVMFGSLAIACVMIAFSFNPVSSLRSGAVLTLLMAVVLLWRAYAAPAQNPRHTEVWLHLDERSRPADRYAIGLVMREIYARFGQASLAVALAFFLGSVIFQALGFMPLDQLPLPHRS